MAIYGLTLVGESINASIPATQKMFDEHDHDGIRELASLQDKKGARYIDVNVGKQSTEFMASIIRVVQEATAKPLAIDSPDFQLARAGLEVYEPARAGGELPLLNSISPLRKEMFELYAFKTFKPVLLVSENLVNGKAVMNRTTSETYETAREMLDAAKTHHIPPRDCIFDIGIAPVAIDSEGMTKRTFESIKQITADPLFRDCSFILGLSNFTHMLPAKRPSDSLPVKSTLECALLTKLIPLGFNMIIGSVKRDYSLLPVEHPAFKCLEEILKADGFDVILKIQEFLST